MKKKKLTSISLGKSQSSSSQPSSYLKAALLIHSSTLDAQHFIKCIEEKLMCFFCPPYVVGNKKYAHRSEECYYYPTMKSGNDDYLFKSLDKIDSESLFHIHNCNSSSGCASSRFLQNYDIVFFTMNANNFGEDDGHEYIIRSIFSNLVNRNQLSIVFMGGGGGNNTNMANVLGYLNKRRHSMRISQESFIKFQLKNNSILQSQSFITYFRKYQKDSNIMNTKKELILEMGSKAIATVKRLDLVNENDWHYLAQSHIYDEYYSLVIHKSRKIMFIPFYGLSHGVCCFHDLVHCLVKYLVMEHLKLLKPYFVQLWKHYLNNQLSDIQLITI